MYSRVVAPRGDHILYVTLSPSLVGLRSWDFGGRGATLPNLLFFVSMDTSGVCNVSGEKGVGTPFQKKPSPGMKSPSDSSHTPSKINLKKTVKQLSSEGFDKIFGPATWPKFFSVELQKKDDFLLDNLLLEQGHDITLNKFNNGLRLIEVHTEDASNTLNE